MKVKSTLPLGVVAALSAMALIGAGIEFPISQACAQQTKSPGVSFAEDIAPISRDGVHRAINRAAKVTTQAGSI